MEKQKIPCVFYLYLHSKLFEMFNGSPLSTKEVKTCLFQWKIPRKLRPIIMAELEMLGLIKKNKFRVEFERPKFNEQSYNKYYQQLGIF